MLIDPQHSVLMLRVAELGLEPMLQGWWVPPQVLGKWCGTKPVAEI